METIDFQDIDLSGSCLTNLSDFFEPDTLEELGREVKFIERSSSRLTAWMFVLMNTCFIKSSKETSLNDLSDELWEQFGIRITKQSLDERFNIYGVALMKKCFETVLEKVLNSSTSTGWHCSFNRVILRDATSFQLPAHLKTFYEGNGGDTTGSVIKIQHEYELLSKKVLRLDFRNGKENDVQWLNEKSLIVEPNDLHLMDLGYYKLANLIQIAMAGGYFVSRYKIGTGIFSKNTAGEFEPLNWQEVLKDVDGIDYVRQVWIGDSKQKLSVNLHLQKLPEEVAQKRLKKYLSKDKNISKNRRQYQTSDLKKILATFNIFITNTQPGQLRTEEIYHFYKLRWQIELLFKIWKSQFKIDKIGKMSIARFECYLYGKFIAILIGGHIQALFSQFMEEKEDFEISEWKGYKILKKS